MDIIASYYTDIGSTKQVNQDSLSVKIVNSPMGKIVFAIICDGMGGLEQGELASKEVVITLNQWFQSTFAKMVATDLVSETNIFREWTKQIETMNQRLAQYAKEQGIMLGTTLTMLLIYQDKYYICHVGDSRIYCLGQKLEQLTVDHTLVAQEVRMGMLTKEQAKKDPRKSILLQCVGASEVIEPQFEVGFIREDATFILCSDGFVHELTENEISRYFRPDILLNKNYISEVCENMVRLAMDRGERDNITVVGIVVKM